MNLRNAEGIRAFDLEPHWHKERAPGLSALVRLRDEEAWCRLAIESILPWCDECIVTLNACSDRTPEIVNELCAETDKIKICAYPFKLHPMGPGHDKCSPESVHSAAYFYNWTQALSSHTHVVKWDGDMVAMDWLGGEIRSAMAMGHDRITFSGIDIVGEELRHLGCVPMCWRSSNNGVYKVTPDVHYRQGAKTQHLTNAPDPSYTIERPAFLHFKWARKSLEAATVQWPENWHEIEHFRTIIRRREPVAEYTGEYPSSVAEML